MPSTSPIPSARTLLTVAWMSILLGICVEVAVMVALLVLGKSTPAGTMLADGVSKVSWSFFVCVGVALGMGAARLRPVSMGLLGLLAAPVAFVIAKAAHKSVAQAMGMAAGPPQVPGPVEMAILRALEYGLLGGVAGWASRQPVGFKVYAGLGAAIGLVAAGIVTLLAARSGAEPAALVVKSINEVLFPVGCSIVLFAAHALGKRAESAG